MSDLDESGSSRPSSRSRRTAAGGGDSCGSQRQEKLECGSALRSISRVAKIVTTTRLDCETRGFCTIGHGHQRYGVVHHSLVTRGHEFHAMRAWWCAAVEAAAHPVPSMDKLAPPRVMLVSTVAISFLVVAVLLLILQRLDNLAADSHFMKASLAAITSSMFTKASATTVQACVDNAMWLVVVHSKLNASASVGYGTGFLTTEKLPDGRNATYVTTAAHVVDKFVPHERVITLQRNNEAVGTCTVAYSYHAGPAGQFNSTPATDVVLLDCAGSFLAGATPLQRAVARASVYTPVFMAGHTQQAGHEPAHELAGQQPLARWYSVTRITSSSGAVKPQPIVTAEVRTTQFAGHTEDVVPEGVSGGPLALDDCSVVGVMHGTALRGWFASLPDLPTAAQLEREGRVRFTSA